MATATRPQSTINRADNRKRLTAVLGATVIASALWLIATQALGNPLLVRGTTAGATQEIDLLKVVMTSVVAGAAAWGLLVVLERFSRKGRKIWMIAAVAVLALSMAGPLTQALDVSTQIALVLMHLSVAAVLMILLPRSSTPKGH